MSTTNLDLFRNYIKVLKVGRVMHNRPMLLSLVKDKRKKKKGPTKKGDNPWLLCLDTLMVYCEVR